MLNVRGVKTTDIFAMYKLLSDDYTAHMLGFTRGLSMAQVSRYVSRNEEYLYIFEDKYKNFVGYFKTNLQDALPTATVAVLPCERRKGYATEMYKTVLSKDVTCMVASVLTENNGSIATLKRCGFKKQRYSNNKEKVVYLYQKEVK